VDLRFKQQRVLGEANRLPVPHIFNQFLEEDPSIKEAASDLSSSLLSFISDLLSLQTDLLDKSIPLLSGEVEVEGEENLLSEAKNVLQKRKRDVMEEEDLSLLYQELQVVDDTLNLLTFPVIDKWNHRTSLVDIKSTKFKAFDSSLSEQVTRALQDKQRLVERSRINRSAHRVVGQSQGTFEIQTESDLKIQDPEIFDDTDFFQNILKDLNSTLSREEFLGMPRIQPKTKTQKNRTRRTKERSLRMEVHPKLVNFVSSSRNNVEGDVVASLLFKNLFQSA